MLFKKVENKDKELSTQAIVLIIAFLIMVMLAFISLGKVLINNLDTNIKDRENIQDIELLANDLIKNDSVEVQNIGLKLLKIRNIDKLNLNSTQKKSAILDNLIDIRLEINDLLSNDNSLEYLKEASKEIDKIIEEIEN